MPPSPALSLSSLAHVASLPAAWTPPPAPAARQFAWAPVLAAPPRGPVVLPEMSPSSPALSRSRWLARVASLPWTLLALSAVGSLAFASRLRYMTSFHGVYGTGDGNLILTHALFMKDRVWEPSSHLVVTHSLFDQPPLIPAVLAAVSQATGLSLELTPLVVVPIVTTAALLVLTRLLARVYGWPAALAAAALIALLPRFSFDSTEPEKAPFVVSLFIFALAALYAGATNRRYLLVSGLCMGLAMLAHTTAYFFLPVLVLSYLALHARSLRSAWNRYALGALVFPLAAVVVYFALARYFREPAVAAGSGEASGGVLPGFVQVYVDAFWNLFRGGFGDSAMGLYIHGIRAQLGTPILALALGGFALGVYEIAFERKWGKALFLLWALIVTAAFAIQYPASSHGSRYPSYVTPAYIVLAVAFVASLAERAAAHRPRIVQTAAVAAVIAFVGYTGASYAFASNPGMRDLYASHEDAARYVTAHGLLDDGTGLLYMEWPSTTFYLLDERPDYGDRLYTFGFGLLPLDTITPEFIQQHDIGYYLQDHTGRDSQRSADTVLLSLKRSFTLEEVATFRGRPGSYSALYRLHGKSVWRPSDLAPLFLPAIAGRAGTLANETLCRDSSGDLPGWEANGKVTIQPAPASAWPCGVLVKSTGEYGGVRQFVDAPGLLRAPFSVLAALRPADVNPAKTAVIAVYDDRRLVAEYRVDLARGQNYVAVEGYRTPDSGPLRVVVATRAGDSGDLVIDSVVMRQGLIRDLIQPLIPPPASE